MAVRCRQLLLRAAQPFLDPLLRDRPKPPSTSLCVHKCTDMGSAVCSVPMWKPVDAPANASGLGLFLLLDEIMKPASADGTAALPNDVLIVEDDPILALDFEDTILGFGVKTVRTAGSVARALDMIADRPPDFALLDVGLVSEKTFAIAERLN